MTLAAGASKQASKKQRLHLHCAVVWYSGVVCVASMPRNATHGVCASWCMGLQGTLHVRRPGFGRTRSVACGAVTVSGEAEACIMVPFAISMLAGRPATVPWEVCLLDRSTHACMAWYGPAAGRCGMGRVRVWKLASIERSTYSSSPI